MNKVLTKEDIKARIAAAEAEEAKEELELEAEVVTDEEEEIIEAEESEEGEESTDKVIPGWMAEEDEEAEEDPEPEEKKTGSVRDIVKLRQGRREAREAGEVKDARIAELESKLAQSSTPQELGPKPKLMDYDSDEAYEAAIDGWYEKRSTSTQSATQDANSQVAKYERLQKKINESYEAHIDRADKLVKEHGIKPDVYQKAEESVLEAIIDAGNFPQGVDPNKGAELYLHSMVDVMGEGSEKVIYHLGVNKKAQKEFALVLASDPNGLKAAAWLGAKSAELRGNKTKRRSNAPKPATQTNGDTKASVASKGLQKQYNALLNKGEMNAAFKMRSDARKTGVDVSNWMK